ncbi:hypothetical protein LguiA_026316 [Lonicera macranthoides]
MSYSSSSSCSLMVDAPFGILIPSNSNVTSIIVGLFLPLEFKHLFARLATFVISSFASSF